MGELQKDLDAFLDVHNRKRPHQGRSMNGRTPYEAFQKGLPKPETDKETPADMKAA